MDSLGLFVLIVSIGLNMSQRDNNGSLRCDCMEYWDCILKGGVPEGYCNPSETKVAILNRSSNVYICGGSLLDEFWVLTAAHCVDKYEKNPNLLKIRLGEYDVEIESKGLPYEEFAVKKVMLHPQFYNITLSNDIALMKLETKARKRPHINIVCLPEQQTQNRNFDNTQKCVVTGWDSSHSVVLKEVVVPVWSSEQCEVSLRNQLGPDFQLSNTLMCAGGDGKDSCDGDGGGPLVCAVNGLWHQIGIVSFGIGCGRRNTPGVYTYVPAYSDWIKSVIKPVFSIEQYEVKKLRCEEGNGSGYGDKLLAKIQKPIGFRGYPYFADDRQIRPATDAACQIRPDPKDTTGLMYRLLITDFQKCGVGKRNGFTTVRIWFPTLPGLVLMSDQEVLLICRPPQSTVTENRAAGIAGNIPLQGRISGTVEESASRPEYGVSVYREAEANSRSGNFEMPVDQAVPIGTKLQLRATVNTESMWKYAKLIEVTVSTDPNNAYQAGFIFLVQKGCRNSDYQTVVPNQPYKISDSDGNIGLEFEAFLLESMSPTDVLWIHTKIKACVKSNDCAPLMACMAIVAAYVGKPY
uniref:Peptidase S1 domain-containing protein n=1 Tax=Strigamia maritima TaxID=126957 RepID=T1IU53_STRMM